MSQLLNNLATHSVLVVYVRYIQLYVARVPNIGLKNRKNRAVSFGGWEGMYDFRLFFLPFPVVLEQFSVA